MDFESGAGVVITLQVADWGDTTPPGEMLEVAHQVLGNVPETDRANPNLPRLVSGRATGSRFPTNLGSVLLSRTYDHLAPATRPDFRPQGPFSN